MKRTSIFHLLGNGHHLFERRGYQTGKADDVSVMLQCALNDRLPRRHDSQVYDVIVVALEHDRHDVLADVVDVAADGGQDYCTAGPVLQEKYFVENIYC